MTEPCPRVDCAEVRDQLADAEKRRTLGGRTRPTTPDWAGGTLPPPDSASDPNAPPKVRPGMRSSRPVTT